MLGMMEMDMTKKRLEVRTNNYPMTFMLSRSFGYGFCEARHYIDPDDCIHLALDENGRVYEIIHTEAVQGPAIKRSNGARGRCDTVPMMYVKEAGVKFLYQSKFRPLPPNRTQTCTRADLKNEALIAQEYAAWRGAKYRPPEPARNVNGHVVYDDGGIRYFEK
jgi:hypothetical protein